MPLYIASSQWTTNLPLQKSSISAPQKPVSSATQYTQWQPQCQHVVGDNATVTFTPIHSRCYRYGCPIQTLKLQRPHHVVAKITNRYPNAYTSLAIPLSLPRSHRPHPPSKICTWTCAKHSNSSSLSEVGPIQPNSSQRRKIPQKFKDGRLTSTLDASPASLEVIDFTLYPQYVSRPAQDTRAPAHVLAVVGPI